MLIGSGPPTEDKLLAKKIEGFMQMIWKGMVTMHMPRSLGERWIVVVRQRKADKLLAIAINYIASYSSSGSFSKI